MKKILLAALVACSLAISGLAQNYFTNFPAITSSKVVFDFSDEVRIKDHQGLYYNHDDIQIKYLVCPNFDVFADYRLIFQNDNNGKNFVQHSMFLPGFDLKAPEGKYGAVSLRTRLEDETQPGKRNTYQLNVFPKYNTPWKFTRYHINPFIADESFYDCNADLGFLKNRVYAGVDYQITPKVKFSSYFYHEASESAQGTWSHANCFVTQFHFLF